VNEPDLLFLDEPTTGLDPQSRRQFWALLGRFRARGGTILITTHYMDEAESLCDRIAIIDQGCVIAIGTPRELIGSLGAEHVIEFAVEPGAAVAADRITAIAGVQGVRQSDGHVYVRVSQLHTVMPALLAELQHSGARLSHFSTHQATLEDVFVALTGRHLRDE
jgi:ABC-2 type transport system ATP-binding protein